MENTWHAGLLLIKKKLVYTSSFNWHLFSISALNNIAIIVLEFLTLLTQSVKRSICLMIKCAFNQFIRNYFENSYVMKITN